MNARSFVVMAVMLAGVMACRPDAQPAGGSAVLAAAGDPIEPDTVFVTAAWLAERILDDEVIVLFAGPSAEFAARRVPGARRIEPALLSQERDGVPGMLPPAQRLETVFTDVGVRADSRVVVYGPPLAAARAFVALERLGHERTSILDGGLAAWYEAGGTVDAAAPASGSSPRADDDFAPARSSPPAPFRHDDDLIVDARWVHEHLHDPAFAFIDARPPAQHRGDEAGDGVPRPGRIPGSANLFWQELLDGSAEPRLRDDAELRALFEAAGAAPGPTIVVYCRTGMQSSFAYAVARHLGYDARVYDGSFIDWSQRRELPVER